ALERFECARTELMRNKLAMSYSALEEKGIFLPLVEAHLEFLGGARYDDLLELSSTVAFSGRARLRFDVLVQHQPVGRSVFRGYTLHAFTDRQAEAIRPPAWFVDIFERAAAAEAALPAR